MEMKPKAEVKTLVIYKAQVGFYDGIGDVPVNIKYKKEIISIEVKETLKSYSRMDRHTTNKYMMDSKALIPKTSLGKQQPMDFNRGICMYTLDRGQAQRFIKAEEARLIDECSNRAKQIKKFNCKLNEENRNEFLGGNRK